MYIWVVFSFNMVLHVVQSSNLHSTRDELLLIFFNKAAKTFKRGSETCSQNFHQGCQSRHNFASTNGTNDITTKIKTEGDFKLANQRARNNNNISCQPMSFGTSHQPISFGTFFGTYISLTNQNVQPKRNGKMSKQLISGTVEVTSLTFVCFSRWPCLQKKLKTKIADLGKIDKKNHGKPYSGIAADTLAVF